MIKARFFLIFLFLIPSLSFAQTYSLWGGQNNKVFLGYLNVNKLDSNSIWNNLGEYGSKYSSLSIWNKYGDYGSKFSAYSPWNKYTSTPPKIFDESGNVYGYFTINTLNSQRVRIEWLLWILDNYEYVFENKDEAYDTIFN